MLLGLTAGWLAVQQAGWLAGWLAGRQNSAKVKNFFKIICHMKYLSFRYV